MTEKREQAVIRIVGRFMDSPPVKEIIGLDPILDKRALTERLAKVMRKSVLKKDKEVLNLAIKHMTYCVESL